MYNILVLDETTNQPLKKASVSFMDGENLIASFETNEEGKVGFFPSDKENFLVWAKKNDYMEEKQGMSILNFSPENDYTQEMRLKKPTPPPVPVAQDCEFPIVLDVRVEDYPNIRPDSGTFVKVYTKPKYFDVSKNPNFLDELAPGTEYVVVVEGEGTTPRTYEISTAGAKPHDTINYEIKLQPGPKDVGQVFYIIYYNYDKSDIRIDASEELNRLERFMKRYPNVTVELASHTDCRGGDLYNDDLSRKRAREAFEYLIKKGINKSRITYKSFGENQLTNKCSNGIPCTEGEHQMNRRTEFKLTGI